MCIMQADFIVELMNPWNLLFRSHFPCKAKQSQQTLAGLQTPLPIHWARGTMIERTIMLNNESLMMTTMIMMIMKIHHKTRVDVTKQTN